LEPRFGFGLGWSIAVERISRPIEWFMLGSAVTMHDQAARRQLSCMMNQGLRLAEDISTKSIAGIRQ
jgi:hypothetical protein